MTGSATYLGNPFLAQQSLLRCHSTRYLALHRVRGCAPPSSVSISVSKDRQQLFKLSAVGMLYFEWRVMNICTSHKLAMDCQTLKRAGY